MIRINTKKCTGCGRCVRDCFPMDIEIINNKARANNIACIKCGHCIAVCPQYAIFTDEYDMNEVINYRKDEFSIDADNLLNFIKFRRSIRQFKDKEVEKEKILKIIEAGRFTQTGGNLQNVSYTIVTKDLERLKELTYKTLRLLGEELLEKTEPNSSRFEKYAKLWLDLYKAYKDNPKNDRLFFNAPVVIVVSANSEVDAALASSNMELMANALGLGVIFSGFSVRAVCSNQEIIELLGIDKNKKVVTFMIIGYPSVKYLRTVPRKKADISWK